MLKMIKFMIFSFASWVGSEVTAGDSLQPGGLALLTKQTEVTQTATSTNSMLLPVGTLVRINKITDNNALAHATLLTPPYSGINVSRNSLEPFAAASTRELSSPELQGETALKGAVPILVQIHPSPNARTAWEQLARAHSENDQLSPEDQMPEPFFARGEFWLALGAPTEALSDYLKGIQIARRKGRDLDSYERFREGLGRAIEQASAEPVVPTLGSNRNLAATARSHFRKGCTAYWEHNYPTAKRYFSNAIQLDPTQPEYWYYRAFTHRHLDTETLAQRDALLGAHAESYLSPSSKRSVTKSLTRQQGNLRAWVEDFRLGDPSMTLLYRATHDSLQ